jgi:wyosine [tRNA(Phe)-imidazoG37] synthetase (radical SAM superfamily)
VRKSEKDRKFIFGPVPSRRLGRSLGVDLVPFKTCTYDCVYCQLGPTTCKTLTRDEWVPTDDVLEQLKEFLAVSTADYITISGSGEPTLHSEVGRIIDEIKSLTDIPVALLTNGSLLWMPEVRDAVLNADLVMPSLDAGSEDAFQKVNRPVDGLAFEEVIEGLVSFRDHYAGEVWLEIFLLAELTAVESEISQMIKLAERMGFDRVQLNTVSRPACEKYARPVPEDQMLRYSARFGINAEVIADYRRTHELMDFSAIRDDVLNLLRHRPCTVDGVASGLGIHRNEVVKYIEELLRQGEIVTTEQGGKVYYIPAE